MSVTSSYEKVAATSGYETVAVVSGYKPSDQWNKFVARFCKTVAVTSGYKTKTAPVATKHWLQQVTMKLNVAVPNGSETVAFPSSCKPVSVTNDYNTFYSVAVTSCYM